MIGSELAMEKSKMDLPLWLGHAELRIETLDFFLMGDTFCAFIVQLCSEPSGWKHCNTCQIFTLNLTFLLSYVGRQSI